MTVTTHSTVIDGTEVPDWIQTTHAYRARCSCGFEAIWHHEDEYWDGENSTAQARGLARDAAEADAAAHLAVAPAEDAMRRTYADPPVLPPGRRG